MVKNTTQRTQTTDHLRNSAPWRESRVDLGSLSRRQYVEPPSRTHRKFSQLADWAAGDSRHTSTLTAWVADLATMALLQDAYTASHENRVAAIACAIAGQMHWSENRIRGLRFAALFHDIGKIMIPAEILHKSGPMEASEMELIRQHAQFGYEILRCIPVTQPIADVVHQHHERLDGSGYPRGLKGDAILPEARVLAVADVVDAVASARSYRTALGWDTALAVIENEAGRKFDEEVVVACMNLIHSHRLPSVFSQGIQTGVAVDHARRLARPTLH